MNWEWLQERIRALGALFLKIDIQNLYVGGSQSTDSKNLIVGQRCLPAPTAARSIRPPMTINLVGGPSRGQRLIEMARDGAPTSDVRAGWRKTLADIEKR